MDQLRLHVSAFAAGLRRSCISTPSGRFFPKPGVWAAVVGGMLASSVAANAQGPGLAASLGNQSVGFSSVTQTIQFANASSVAAQNVSITSVTSKVTVGTGTVTLSSPALAYALGNLGVGASQPVAFTLNAPTTVRRFTLVENGTLQDTSGNTYQFSLSQLVNVVYPTLSVNPTSLTFGVQGLGTTSSAQTVSVTNTGTVPVSFSSFTPSGDFGISANTCPASLAASASCSVSVTFSPTVFGTRSGALTITDNATGSPQSVALSGTGGSSGLLTFNPSSLAFGSRNVGTTSAAQSFSISNAGTQAITFASFTPSGDFAISANTCGASLAASASCSVSVTFSPTTTGTRTGAVTIVDSANGSPHSVTLSGQGISFTISLNPTSLTFGSQNVGTTSTAQSFSVSNTGTQVVTLTSFTPSGDFAISSNTCGASLAASASCSVSVTFSPTATGTRTGAITIVDSASGSPHSVSLSGSGISSSISLNPTSLTFGSQNVGTTSTAQSFSVSNTGTQVVTLTSFTPSGDFAISSNTCSASLAASASCSVSVTFSPTTTGTRTGAVTIVDSASGSPHSVSLSGSGISSSISLNPTSLTFGSQNVGTTSTAQSFSVSNTGTQVVTLTSFTPSGDFAISSNTCGASLAASASCSVSVTFSPTATGTRTGAITIVDSASGSPHSVSLSGSGISSSISLNPTSLTFGSQNVGTTSTAQSFSVSNTGTQVVTLTSFTPSGDFAISSNTCGASLAASASCSVSVTFSPTTTGTRTGAVTIVDSASGSPHSVSLSGSGISSSISLNPTSLTFGSQNVGTTSTAQSFSVSNTGTQAVTLTSFTPSGDFAISGNTCGASLAASASCSVSVTFSPTATGTRTGAITIVDSASGSPHSVSLSGSGISSSISLNPTSLTFGSQNVGTTSTAQSFSVSNTGTQVVTLTSFTPSGDFAISSNTCGASLAASASCSVSVTFSPTTTGTRTGAVTIVDSASGSPHSVSLSGSGISSSISLNPTSLTFGSQNVGTTSTAQSFSVSNTGTQAVTLTSFTPSGDFAISGNTCGASLAASASCSVSVTFSPTATGTRTGAITIVDSASGSPHSVSLSGSGISSSISLNPTSLTFGSQNVGTTSTAQSFSVSNTGTQVVTLTSFTPSGDFAISSNTCGASLAASASCSVSVTFSPTATGTRTGAITIVDSASGSPHSVSLSGSGISSSISLNPTSLTFGSQNVGTTSTAQSFSVSNTGTQVVTLTSFTPSGDFAISSNTCGASLAASASCSVSVTFSPTTTGTRTGAVTIVDSASGSPHSVSLSGSGISSSISLNPTSLTFGSQNVGTTSTAQSFSVSNTGTQAVTLTSFTPSGDFAISGNTCGASLAASASCSVSVTFSPTTTGTRTGAITIVDSASGSPHSVSLSGSGISTSINISPTSLSFGNQNLNTTSTPLSFSVTNNGTQTVTFTSFTPSADFAISNNTCGTTLAASASCSVSVTFTPTTTGTRNGAISISDNVAGSPQTVTLSGFGVGVGTLTISPPSLTFGNQVTGTTSTSQSFNITNSGTAVVTLSSEALTGANPGDFAIASNSCGSSLGVGSSCTIFVTFSPTAANARSAAVTITDTATGSPQSVSLSGTGQTPTFTLTVSPTTLTYAAQVLNTPSASQGFSISNTGNSAISITSVALTGSNPGDFSISSNSCGSSLSVGSSCAVYVTFTPTAVGTRNAAVTITDNATSPSSPQSVTLTGTGQNQTSTLTLSTNALTFNQQALDSTSGSQDFSITNSGTTTVAFTSILVTGTNSGDFAIASNSCGSSLASGNTCYVYVTFTPTVLGSRSAAVTVTYNASGSPQSVSLSGSGVNGTTFTFNPASLSFTGTNVGTPTSQNLTITNTGTVPGQFSSFSIGGSDPSDFAITANTCPSGSNTLASNSSCTVTVTFTPSAPGARSANLTVSDNAANSPQVIFLGGNGAPQTQTLAFEYLLIPFDNENVSATSAQVGTYVTNTGNITANFSSIAVTGTNAGDFSISTNSCAASYSNTLTPNQSCYVYVTFTPTATGPRNALLTYTDNATGSPQSVVLTGNGVTPAAGATLTLNELSFSATNVGTTASAIYVGITNTGTTVLNISGVTLGGTNANDFTISTNQCASSYSNALPVGDTCYEYVTFTPQAAGTRTATLSFTDNAASSPQTVTITGIGQGVTMTLAPNPAFYAFPATYVGTTATQLYVYLVNTGDATVNFSSYAITGTNASDYSITTNQCSSSYGSSGLPSGGECYIYINFTPGSAGTRAAALTVGSNATGSPLNVPINGVGIAGGLTVNVFPTALIFSQPTGVASAAQTVSVLNSGAEALNITSVAITGPTDYAISANTCPAASSTLASGSTCTIQVIYTPSAVGSTSASLGIVTTAGTQAVALNGTGQSPTETLSVPASITFANPQAVGVTSLAQAITLQNSGNEPVTSLTSFLISGGNASDFAVGSNTCPASLAVGAACTIGVVFTPSATGTRSSSLVITDGASGSPRSVALSGTGVSTQQTLAPNVTSLDFGAIDVATTSTGYNVTFTNTGTGAVTFSGTPTFGGTNPGDFAVTSNNCTGSIASTSACTVTMTFTPGAAGVRTATLRVSDNAFGSPQTVNLIGVGQTVTRTLTPTPTSLSFAATNQGTTSAGQYFYLYNYSDAPVTLSGYSITGTNSSDFAISTNNCASTNTVGPGSYCYIYITFTPSGAGLRTATVQVTDNASNSPQSILVQGAGQAATQVLSFAPSSVDFGVLNVQSTSAATQIVAYNKGTAAVTFNGYTITGTNAGDFSISSNQCAGNNTSPVNSYCYLYVVFTPAAAGVRTATLNFTDNATNSPQSVPLLGTGQAVTMTLSIRPVTYDFGVENLGVTSSQAQIVAYNTGNANVTFTGYTITGANAGDFAITTNQCAGNNTSPVNSYCYLYVAFTPSAAGARSATLNFIDNAAGGTQSVALTGVGQTGVRTLQISPTTLAYTANLSATAGVQYVYFTNTGTAGITFTADSISGTNSADFAISNNYCISSFASGNGLSPNQECYIGITFTPSTAGTETATLNVTNSSSSSAATISLIGQGASLSKVLELGADYITFGAIQVGTSSGNSNYAYLVNVSTGPITPSSFTFSGTNASEFSVTSSSSCHTGTAIPSGGYCYIYVQLTPAAQGLRTATLQITDDAQGTTQNVALAGTGYVSGTTVTPTGVTFPRTKLNTSTGLNSYYAYFYNNSASAIPITAPSLVGPNAADFSITSTNQCGTSIAAHTYCYVYLQFTPSVAGARVAAVEITYSGGTGSVADAPLVGDGNGGSGYIGLDPISLEFAATNLNATAAYQAITLTNTGQGSVNFSNFGFTGTNAADFSFYVNSCTSVLLPDASCNVYVQFTPSGTGLRTATLQVTDDASNTPQTVSLIGVGQTASQVLYTSTANLDFGSVNINGSTANNSISLYSGGTTPVVLTSIQITGTNASEFTFYTNGCGTLLTSSCGITIQFEPTATGTRTANLVITSNAPGSPLTIPLTGLGQPETSALSFNYVNYDFGVVSLNAQATATIAITNQGDIPVAFTVPTLTGTNASDFTITSETCGGSLTAYGACYVYLAFTPGAAGTRTASLQIHDNVAGSPQLISLTGSGQVVNLLLTASTPILDFDLEDIGVPTAQQYVTVANSGNSPVNISSVAISGANAADFHITQNGGTCNSILPSADSCYIYVTFVPSVTGPENATLTIASNSSSGPLLISLVGEGETASKQLTANTTTLDLGVASVGSTTSYKTVEIINNGTDPVNFFPPNITGTNASSFTIYSNGCTGSLAAGSTCYVYVEFAPTAAGLATATLNVNSTASGSPITVTLTGTGTVNSGAVVNLVTPAFAATTVGNSDYEYAYLYDIGTANVTVSSVAINGTNASDFSIYTNECTSGASAGSYCYVRVKFTPSATGTRSAGLVITDSAPGSPHTVPLNGTGQ